MSSDYDIGYKKPPKHSRFQKGKSGNPKGRPKNRSPNMTEVLDKLLSKKVSIVENGHQQTVTTYELVFTRILRDAINGKPYAVRALINLIDKQEKIKGEPAKGDDWTIKKILDSIMDASDGGLPELSKRK